MAEYGCQSPRPRPFTDVAALYGPEMTDVWSGGVVYMYFEEDNEYGLVEAENGKVTKLKDFENYKSQIKKINPKGVSMSSYTPPDLKMRDCPAVGKDWEAHETLPPTPDAKICKCMVDNLTCVPSNKVKTDDIGELIGWICGDAGTDCGGISTDPASGVYGAFSMCTPEEKLAWALDAYYKEQGEAEDACDFKGKATFQDPDTSCSSDLKVVGGLTGDKPVSQGEPVSQPKSGKGSGGNGGSGAGMTTPSLVALFLSFGAVVSSMLI